MTHQQIFFVDIAGVERSLQKQCEVPAERGEVALSRSVGQHRKGESSWKAKKNHQTTVSNDLQEGHEKQLNI